VRITCLTPLATGMILWSHTSPSLSHPSPSHPLDVRPAYLEFLRLPVFAQDPLLQVLQPPLVDYQRSPVRGECPEVYVTHVVLSILVLFQLCVIMHVEEECEA